MPKILSHSKKILLLLVLVVVIIFTVPSEVLAQTGMVTSALQSVLMTIVTTVFGMFAWMGGSLLDVSISTFVVGFGTLYATSGLGFSIDNLWSIVRDIFNLTFIFGLVFIGFKMILNSSDSNARKMLGSLVLAALLVNFSLFITKFVIDFSNIAATQMASGFFDATSNTYEVSESFMNLLGLSSLWANGTLPTAGAGYAYIFGTLILLIVATFVFAAGGILLMIRFAVLNIYMVLSPIMFLGWVFPGFMSTSKSYWSGFLSRAFFAPAYILMLYFANQILVNLKGASGAGNLAAVMGGSPANAQANFASTIPYFILTCVFLIASLVVAQKMGAQGASTAVALGKRASGKARQYAGAATFGAAAVAGQRSIGYGAHKLSNNETFKKYAAKNKWVGEKALKATRAVADSSFDARQVGGFGAAAGIGTGTKAGYKSRIEEQKKADAEFAKSLGETKVEKKNGEYVDQEIKERVEAGIAAQRSDENSDLHKENFQREAAGAAKQAAEKALAEADPFNVAEIEKLNARVAEAGADVKKSEAKVAKMELEARKQEELKIKYEKQLAFISRRESEGASLRSRLPNYSSAGTGMMAGGLVAGSMVIPAGLVSAPIAHSFGNQNQESADNLRKIYGADGSSAESAKSKKENLRILAEELKEAEGPAETKKAE